MTGANKNYIVEFNGEPVIRIKFQTDGKADISIGDLNDAVWFTREEALECASAIGQGAEAVRK